MWSNYLQKLGISELNDMQLAAIRAAEKHPDIVLHSPTGTGKTLAYLLPLAHRLAQTTGGLHALIIVPSRELALQIEKVFKMLDTGLKINAFYGGHSLRTELNSLRTPPAVIVGTPGRLLDLITRGSLGTSEIHELIIDEFDKSLEMGFGGEMSSILEHLPALQRKFLTSATQAVSLPSYLQITPYTLDFTAKAGSLPQGLHLKMVEAIGNDKLETLYQLLCSLGSARTLVFCNHRDAADRIGQLLTDKGVFHRIYHGGHEQETREKTLICFRNGSVNILLATDLAARGLDIAALEHVIHYQLPLTSEAFIHRNGRTARMKASGAGWLITAQGEPLPRYISIKPESVSLPLPTAPPPPPSWVTLEFSAGKKDKVSKVDIAGTLHKKAGLAADQVGLIDITDTHAYAAVAASEAATAARLMNGEHVKKVKVRVLVVGS